MRIWLTTRISAEIRRSLVNLGDCSCCLAFVAAGLTGYYVLAYCL